LNTWLCIVRSLKIDRRLRYPAVMPAAKTWAEMRTMMERLLVERTGADVGEWNKRIAAEKPVSEAALRAWLSDHGITGYAQMLLVMETFGYPDFLTASADELLDGQYADRKTLRPVLDALLAFAATMESVTVQVRKTYVTLITPPVRADQGDHADSGGPGASAGRRPARRQARWAAACRARTGERRDHRSCRASVGRGHRRGGAAAATARAGREPVTPHLSCEALVRAAHTAAKCRSVAARQRTTVLRYSGRSALAAWAHVEHDQGAFRAAGRTCPGPERGGHHVLPNVLPNRISRRGH
jgi:hypothetical protein